MSDEMREEMFNERNEWIESMGGRIGYVPEDEDGEYILIESENGNPGEEGYSVDTIKVRLPKHLQLSNING